MSSDDYFLIRRHPKGGYAVLHGFASYEDDGLPEATPRDQSFATFREALDYARGFDAEYGVTFAPEVAIFHGDWREMQLLMQSLIKRKEMTCLAEGCIIQLLST